MEKHHQESGSVGRIFLIGGTLVGLLVIAGLYARSEGYLGETKREAAEPAPFTRQGNKVIVPEGSPLRSRLSFSEVASRPVDNRLRLPAVVEADPARTFSILPPLSGRLVDLRVGLGDHVAEKQILAVIDSPDLAQALDDDDKAADALQLAEKSLERAERQFNIGTESAQDLDQARSNAAQARAERERTQARLRTVNPANGNGKGRRLEIRSPVAGSVTSLTAAPGNMVNDPTQPIMTIADLSNVWVTAMVPERDVAAVQKGQTADVVLDAYPGEILQGKVSFVSDLVEPDTRRTKVRISFDNSLLRFKPNMFATVTLHGPESTEVVLPTSALLMNNDRITVFVATGDWTFERRIIETKLDEGTEVAVSSGLASGERVLVKGAILLND